MGKEEMATLLETMLNDAEVAGRVAGGDFSDLSDGELTDAERALLSAAGGDLNDDVSGFGFRFNHKIGDKDWKVEEGTNWKVEMENVRFALDHLDKAVFKF